MTDAVSQILSGIRDELLLTLGATDPRRINEGSCEDFMWLAVKLLGRAVVEEAPVDGHMALRIGAKYYDAECTTGVDRLEDLPYCRRVVAAGYPLFPWMEDLDD